MMLAKAEAERLSHNYIGTEHLLLGLAREENSLPGKVLRQLGANADRISELVEKMTGAGRRQMPANLELTPRTKQVLEFAIEEAKKLGNAYIGAEHLLLGLIRQTDGVAIDVINRIGLTADRIRRETMRAIQAEKNEASGGNPPSTEQPKQKGRDALPAGGTPASPLPKDRPKTPALDQVARDLTALAEQGKLDPVIGRQTEIERVIQILSRRTKNNPSLIGEPGVGKTAVVEGLAQRIVEGQVPEILMGRRVMQLDVGSLVAGTMYRGQFEERLKKIMEEVRSSHMILFIDEFHMLVGAGAAGSSVDAANILKPALARGELQCIGATTLNEYRQHIESDAALERRFQPIYVEEPTPDQALEILRGVRSTYENHHQLRISDDALQAAVKLGTRYVTERYLPDKAIDLIDETSARVRMYKSTHSVNLQKAFKDLRDVQKRRDKAMSDSSYDEAAALRDQEANLEEMISTMRANYNPTTEGPVVNPDDIAEVVAMWTGIPVTRIAGSESERLLKLEDNLRKRVIGQTEAINALAKAMRRARVGLKDPKRPVGSFIFLGPTGVGKTELTKALAECVFGNEDALMVLDMSEFMERHTVSRLVGAPPGYIGYEDAGQLTETIRRRPYTIVVFDEIEKAHPEVFNMLLQIMEEGRLSDARGRKVDFRNTIIIMTSNVGADMIKKDTKLGFTIKKDDVVNEQRNHDELKEKLTSQLKRMFRPEFLNRIDATIVFHALSKEQIGQIVALEVNKVQKRLSENNIQLELTEPARSYLAEKGYNPEMGARPLRRLIQNEVEEVLSDGLLGGTFADNSRILIDALDGKLTFTVLNEVSGSADDVEIKEIMPASAPALIGDPVADDLQLMIEGSIN
ncbi:MAG: ATP-dependent Clp protease ATP-binding subunit [Anaerolineae bacterium]|nr:ATP-dependent Clp protease ATP-binding subunit [Anaerolineae bacterium]